LRGVGSEVFKERQNWALPADVPDEARAEFRLPDGRTSLWDETIDGTRRDLIALALASQRRYLRALRIAPLFSADIPVSVLERLQQTDGDTPVLEARPYHYELGNPSDVDYASFAIAVDKRLEPFSYPTPSVADLLEEAVVSQQISLTSLHPNLQMELQKVLRKRIISATDLRAELDRHTVVDIRCVYPESIIPGAQWIDPKRFDVESPTMPHGIGKKQPIVMYCANGEASRAVARRLRHNGYQEVRILDGGYESW